MKTSFAKIAGGLALLAVSSVAMASIIDSKHNLSSTNQTGGNYTTGTSEICIFCHTPHGADQSVDAPLWNRSVSTSPYQRFSAMGRLTFDAKEAPIGSVSAACLSCHDGTQAMDSVINAPGGGSNPIAAGGTTNPGGWNETNAMSTMAGNDNGNVGDSIYLGTDLRNDHPISMQYGGGNMTDTSPTAQTLDPDFAQYAVAQGNPGGPTAAGVSNAGVGNTTGAVAGSGTGSVKNNGVAGAGRRWYVDTGVAGFQGTDFPLYTRTNITGNGGAIEPTVECATCHDPHSSNTTFLRLTNGNNESGVCLTCHAK